MILLNKNEAAEHLGITREWFRRLRTLGFFSERTVVGLSEKWTRAQLKRGEREYRAFREKHPDIPIGKQKHKLI